MINLEFDILVVGGGPAGLAAACIAAESGRHVALIDETAWLGGQIWRGHSRPSAVAATWLARFRSSEAAHLDRTCIIGCPEPGLLLAEREGQPSQVRWKKLVVATGARELFLPFPGWTLPGVVGAGGLLNLVKHGWPVQGQRIVVAGTGPLLLAAAQGLLKHGARVIAVVEQASIGKAFRFALGLYHHPAKLWQGLCLRVGLRSAPFRFGAWPVSAEGTNQIHGATFSDGQHQWTLECDALACGFGLVPNVELPAALGCELRDGFVRVDHWQATSIPNVYCAGEPTGTAGADSALVQGQIAGYAVSRQPERAEALFKQRASWSQFGHALQQAFALRPELKSLAQEETLVCRCEDVSLGRLRQFRGWREAKLQARCGMGACQGRVCGPATSFILGWGMESVRPPISPARIGSLIANPETNS